MLYHHFESKDHIYGTPIEQGVRVPKEILGRTEKTGPDLRSRLGQFVREYVELCHADRGLARTARRELAVGGAGRAKLLARLARLLAEAAEVGAVRATNLELPACSLIGMMNVFHDLTLLGAPTVEVDAATERTLDLFLNGAGAR